MIFRRLSTIAAVVVLGAATGAAQTEQLAPVPQMSTPPPLVHPQGATAPPMVVTLQAALQRAQVNDSTSQQAVAAAAVARAEAAVARAALLPAASNTTQSGGNQASGVNPSGRAGTRD